MRVSLTVFAVLFMTASSGFAQPGKGASARGWLNNLETAREQSRRTGKPIFVVFRCEP